MSRKPSIPHRELAEIRRAKRIESIRAKLDEKLTTHMGRSFTRLTAKEPLTREDVQTLRAYFDAGGVAG